MMKTGEKRHSNEMDQELRKQTNRQVALKTWVYQDFSREVSLPELLLQLARSLKKGSKVEQIFS